MRRTRRWLARSDVTQRDLLSVFRDASLYQLKSAVESDLLKASEPLTKNVEIDAPCEYVFDFIVRLGNMVRWMEVDAQLDPRPGGVVLEIVRPTKISFTSGWARPDIKVPAGSTIVMIALESIARGTRLTLVHRKLPEDMRDNHDAGWTLYLGRLKMAAEEQKSWPGSLRRSGGPTWLDSDGCRHGAITQPAIKDSQFDLYRDSHANEFKSLAGD
jgi:uncharacterized protein YndB with AHSA1/START domain